MGLKPRTLEILQFCDRYLREHTVGPTMSEIAAGASCTKGGAAYQMNVLEMQGLIRRKRFGGSVVSRHLRVTKAGKAALEASGA